MKVLFLDVDGVLNTRDSPGNWPLDQDKVERVVRIVRETGCLLVLSSSWRTSQDGRNILEEEFLCHNIYIYSVTPDFWQERRSVRRGEEIEAWLSDRPYFSFKVAILDDWEDAKIEKENARFFQTDQKEGLTENICGNIISFFKD